MPIASTLRAPLTRRICAILTASGLVAALCAVLVLSSAATPGARAMDSLDGFGQVADSATSDESPFLTGHVVADNPQTPVADAVVYAMAWPASVREGTFDDSAPFEMLPMAKTLTLADGSFSLGVGVPQSISDDAVAADGLTDIEVVTVVGHETSITTMTVDLNSTTSAELAHDSEAVASEAGSPEAAALTEDSDDDDTHRLVPMGHLNGRCPGGPGLKTTYPDRWVHVGSIHLGANGKRMKFTFNEGSKSTLGTAVSLTGVKGTWSASGSVTQSTTQATTGSVSWPWYEGKGTNYWLDTAYSYGRFCVEYSDSMHGTGHYYKARSIRHEGGTRNRSTTKPTANYCTKYLSPGSGGKVKKYSATTWTDGAKLEGPLGINLSSRTGYSSANKIKFTFRKPGRLCGTNGQPFKPAPGTIVMRSL